MTRTTGAMADKLNSLSFSKRIGECFVEEMIVFEKKGCAGLKPRCRRMLHRCREFPRAAERIIRMSLNPLDGVWIAIHRLTVEFIGEEVT